MNLILFQIINPSSAVNQIGTNYGLLGSLFIIVLALLLGALFYIKKSTSNEIKNLNIRLDMAEQATKEARDDLVDYVLNDHSVLVEVIKNYSDNNEKLKVILEKIIIKI